FRFADPSVVYDEVGERASFVPYVADRIGVDVRHRRAAVRYWSSDYANLIAPDKSVQTPEDDMELQFVAANAAYRAAQRGGGDRATVIRSLDATVNAYLGVLKASPRNEDAAYN